jgi:hypothetical protein
MKIKSYSICEPSPLSKQWMILANDADSNVSYPLFYIQRPKHIKDDACWTEICKSIVIRLPIEYEVK